MGVDSGVLWVADFENDLRFQVRRPNRRQMVSRRPPVTPELKENDRYVVMDVNFGVFRVADMDNDLKDIPPSDSKFQYTY